MLLQLHAPFSLHSFHSFKDQNEINHYLSPSPLSVYLYFLSPECEELKKKQSEEAITFNQTVNREEEEAHAADDNSGFNLRSFIWHGGSIYDAWFSCASNQVAQVLLTLPYSFSQLGMLLGIVFQVFYEIMGSWIVYLISILYVEYRSRKEKENVSFKNAVIQWFEVLDREWCNGQSHGVGVQTYSNGSCYIEELKYGAKHDLGCYHLRSVLRFLISTVHSIAAKLRDREKHQEPFRT
ncbi:hypothetical protein ACFXTO_023159 [Malus domestica]